MGKASPSKSNTDSVKGQKPENQNKPSPDSKKPPWPTIVSAMCAVLALCLTLGNTLYQCGGSNAKIINDLKGLSDTAKIINNQINHLADEQYTYWQDVFYFKPNLNDPHTRDSILQLSSDRKNFHLYYIKK